MDPEIKAKWLAALRSGTYIQTQGVLKRRLDFGRLAYCCLGVLCEIMGATSSFEEGGVFRMAYRDEERRAMIPESAARDAKLGSIAGALAEKNDNGWSFAQIADYIEENL